MPDGEMRRPPQLWEERLARTTSLLSVGLTPGDATAVVSPTPVPGSDGGVEPSPVLPPPGAFIKPSTPQLIGGLQGINVLWDGLNSESELWPYDTSYVEVHMDTTGTAFTPGTATLKGRLARPGSLFVGGLTAGTTYYFKLRGADPAGNVTDPSDAASGLTGLTTAGDYGTATIGTGAVSFNARTIGGVTNTVGSVAPSNPLQGDVWLDNSPGTAIIHKIYNGSTWVTNAWGSASIAAGQVTALQIAAGAVTAGAIAAGAVTTDKLTAGTITGFRINGGTISGGFISGGTLSGGVITGGTVQGTRFETRSGSSLIRIDDDVVGPYGTADAIEFINGSTSRALISWVAAGANSLDFYSDKFAFTARNGAGAGDTRLDVYGTCAVAGPLNAESLDIDFGADIGTSFYVGGSAVDLPGVYDNNTTGIDTVGITATNSRLRRISSSQLIKYDITPLTKTLAETVDEPRISDVATVNPADVLDVAVTEFSVIDDGEPTERRVLGFIADDVAEKLPIAVTVDSEGRPGGVLDTGILAAVLAVVQEQQATITDLRARIEALEA